MLKEKAWLTLLLVINECIMTTMGIYYTLVYVLYN